MAVTRQIPIIKSIKAPHSFPTKKKKPANKQQDFKVRNEHL